MLLLTAWLVSLTGGCLAPAQPAMIVWSADDMTTMTNLTQPTQVNPSGPVRLTIAINETVAFQIIVDWSSPGGELTLEWDAPMTAAGVRMSDDAVRVYNCLPVRVESAPAWHIQQTGLPAPAFKIVYDALEPVLAGRKLSAGASNRQVFWIDVHVNRQTMPGLYSGKLRLLPAGHRAEIDIELNVQDLVLPDRVDLALVGGFEHAQVFKTFIRRGNKPFDPVQLDRSVEQVSQGLIIIRQLMRLARAHKLDLFDHDLTPVLKRDLEGKIRLDWSDFDAIVLPYLDGSAFDDGTGVACWPIPVRDDWPLPDYYGGTGGAEYRQVLSELLRLCAKHMGTLSSAEGKTFAWPNRLGTSGGTKRHGNELDLLAPRAVSPVPVMSQSPNIDADSQLSAENSILMLAPAGRFFDPSASSSSKHPLAGPWLSPDHPPYAPSLGVFASPAEIRALPWLAWRFDARGVFIPYVFDWLGKDQAKIDQQIPLLFYPGMAARLQQVFASTRLKHLRRGMQDLAYVQLMQQRNLGQKAEEIASTIARHVGLAGTGDNFLDARPAGWAGEDEPWRLARSLMAAELLSVIHPGKQAEEDLHSARSNWNEAISRLLSVRIEQVRCIPSLISHQRWDWNILVELWNPLPHPVDVLVQLDSLPQGWQELQGTQRLLTMPARQRTRVQLSASDLAGGINQEGKTKLPLTLTAQGRTVNFSASVSLLWADFTARPPKIDGLLDDWAVRDIHQAGGFTKLAPPTCPPADLQTSVRILQGPDALYIAITCDDPDPSNLNYQSGNEITYEGLSAWGEDSVEIILDPGRRAKDVEDLYHILVKPNGLVLARRGIEAEWPLGKVESWPAKIVSSAGRTDTAWTVELAIPLDAFGPEGRSRIWGINFARFSTRSFESSSWASGMRQLYDVKNLGMLALPRVPAVQESPQP